MTSSKLTHGNLISIQDRVASEKQLRPDGIRSRITIHMGTCGLASGARDVLDAISQARSESGRADISVTSSGCIGLCNQEPLVTVETLESEPIVYATVDRDSALRIFDEHVLDGKVVLDKALFRGLPLLEESPPPATDGPEGVPHVSEFPFFALQHSRVLRNRGRIDPENIEDYIWREGYQATARALLDLTPQEIITEIKASGLRGRGGGGFPTGMKWEFCASAKGDTRYILCNADEGDPGAFMDRAVMEGDPHAILEGMIIAAKAIGANRGYVYCRAEYPLAVRTLTRAIEQARELGLLGTNILGSRFDLDIEIYQGAGAFVCGEETALITSIEGKRGTPRPRPPFPAVMGLWQQPTVLNNVETFANIPRIILRGSAEYTRLGTEGSKGTKVFALTGNVRNIGLVEVPMGTPLGRIIFDIGGGIPSGKRFKAAQLGGPSGGCLPAEHLNTPVDYEEIARAGAIMGSGGLIVMDEDTCMVDMARYFMDFCQDESCGKCTPCRVGTRRMLQILERICGGEGRAGDIELLEELSSSIKDAALCGLGQTAPNPVLSTLRYFRAECEAHVRDKRCAAVVCSELFESPCQHACPLGTDVPAYVALVRADRIDDAYEVLKRTNPFPSVCARVCYHPCQSKCRRGQLDQPVAIRNLKRFVADHTTRTEQRRLPSTQQEKIAVIGAGPSGLTAALELRKRGYPVTVFEEQPEAGGMLRWGIPEYRLPKDILAQEIQEIVSVGIELRTSTLIGRDITFRELDREFDRIYVAVGAQRSAELGIEGEKAAGVIGAVEFLRDHNLGRQIELGRQVVVVGGGNTAVDAARTAVRLGAEQVTIAYRRERAHMPALAGEIQAAVDEGVVIRELLAPKRILVEEDHVTDIELTRMQLAGLDRSARKLAIPIPGLSETVTADTIISAIGQNTQLAFLPPASGVESERDQIAVDDRGRTSNPKVYAGGDVVTGPDMVIHAIQAGQRAASAIDEDIRRERGRPAWRAPVEEVIPVPFDEEGQNGEIPQASMPEASPDERNRDFREVELGYTRSVARKEASRCQRCDVSAEKGAQ